MTGGGYDLAALPCRNDTHRLCAGVYAVGPAGSGRLWVDCFCPCHDRTPRELAEWKAPAWLS